MVGFSQRLQHVPSIKMEFGNVNSFNILSILRTISYPMVIGMNSDIALQVAVTVRLSALL